MLSQRGSGGKDYDGVFLLGSTGTQMCCQNSGRTVLGIIPFSGLRLHTHNVSETQLVPSTSLFHVGLACIDFFGSEPSKALLPTDGLAHRLAAASLRSSLEMENFRTSSRPY